MDAAAKLKPDSPAYTWLTYYRARLLVESGKPEPARALLDQVLVKSDAVPVSARNPLLSLRMQVAANLPELLKYAQRTPAGIIVVGDDNGQIPVDFGGPPQFVDFSAHPSFGPDSTAVLNNKLPLATLVTAAASPDLPSNLRKQLQIAAWVRAVILNDGAAASALAPLARDAAPDLRPYLEAYISAKTPAQNITRQSTRCSKCPASGRSLTRVWAEQLPSTSSTIIATTGGARQRQRAAARRFTPMPAIIRC